MLVLYSKGFKAQCSETQVWVNRESILKVLRVSYFPKHAGKAIILALFLELLFHLISIYNYFKPFGMA